jgi:hypothetical protein
VLKPGGSFLIADILNRSESGRNAVSFWQRRMNLNRWTLEEYRQAMRVNGLRINHQEDITRLVLHGYRHACIWNRTFLDQSLIPALMGYTWGKAMAAINCILLLTLRRYFLFLGENSKS